MHIGGDETVQALAAYRLGEAVSPIAAESGTVR
jgi:hypothetical protein